MITVIDTLTEKRSVPTWALLVLAVLAGGWASAIAVLVALAGNSALSQLLQ